jgi:hypothetical protein
LNPIKKPKKKNSLKNKKKLKIFIPLSLQEYTEKPVDLKEPEVCLEVCPEVCLEVCPEVWTPLNSLNKLKEDKDLLLMM